MSVMDFWYLLGFDYEVTVFRTRKEAEEALADLNEYGDDGYYHLFKGRFGERFSGWVGHQLEHAHKP